MAEAWRLSKIPYQEVVYRSLAEEKGRMWWGAFGQNHPDMEDQSELELNKRALRIARFDKMIVSIFNIVVCIVPFVPSFFGTAFFGLASSTALSLAVAFGLTTLYAIQTLSSFVGAESSILLSTLPIAQEDFSLITLFSFVRSVDYIVIGAVSTQAAVVALITGSPLATMVMLVTAIMNELFALTIALWFSRIFQKSLSGRARSRVNSALRLVFILMWGLLLVGVGFLFSIPWYVAPNLESMLLSFGQTSNLLLSLVYPFSAGILISSIVCSNVASITVIITSFALAGYGVLAILSGKWNLRTVKNISQEAGMKSARVVAGDTSVKIHRPLFGYVLKDVKIASRNPATAFFFALPVLETIIITLLISNLETLRTAIVLNATAMSAISVLFVPLALLTAEGKGLEYTKVLPISPQRIVVSKTLVCVAIYALVPSTFLALCLIKNLNSLSSLLIPFLVMISVASASIFEIKLFLKANVVGKIRAILSDMEKLIVGILTVLVTEGAYATVFLLSLNHGLSLLAMGIIAFSELAVAMHSLGHS